MSKKSRRAAKEAALRGTAIAAPGFLSAIFSFFRSLFGGKSAKSAAKELGEQAVDAAETIVSEVVETAVDPKA